MNKKNKSVFISAMALLAIGLITTGCASTAVPASAPASAEASVNKEEIDRRLQIFMNHIRAEGFVPTIDEDNDILFKKEGLSYYIHLWKEAPEFVQIYLPHIRELKSDSDRRKAVEAASSANYSTKFAKAYIESNNNWVSLSLETVMMDPSDFEALFSRMVDVLDLLKEKFESQM